MARRRVSSLGGQVTSSQSQKQVELTRTLDLAAISKNEFCDAAITLRDIEHVWEMILNVPSHKLQNGAPGAKTQTER